MRTAGWVLIVVAGLGPLAGAQQYSPFPTSGPGGGDDRSANMIASVEFVNTEITTVFRMVSDQTGWSIVMSPKLTAAPPKVNLWVKNMTAAQLLGEVGRLAQLVIQRDGSTVHVMSFDEYAQIYGLTKTVIPLKYARAAQAAEVVKPYVVKEEQVFIVADVRANALVLMAAPWQAKALEELVKTLDAPDQLEQVQVVPLAYLGADEVALPLEQFLSEAGKGEKDPSLPEYKVQFMVQPGLNVVVIRGDRFRVAKAVELLRQLDVPRQSKVVSYELTYSDAAEVYKVLTDLLTTSSRDTGDTARLSGAQRMRISVSQGGNRIVVEGSEQDQKRAAEIIASVDKPALPGSGGIRVYRLENTSAQDVVDVLKALVEEQEAKATVQTPLASTPPGAMPRPRRGDVRQPDDLPAPRPSPSPATPASPAPAPKGSISITAAPDVNAVVIRAPAADQEAFADVIAQLDRPRDQVMLEMTLVTVSSDDTFRFGLEMGGSGFSGGTGQVSFTTFGIGQADSTTGSLVIDPDAPFGLNYNLFHSDDFSLVVNALQTVGDVRISSAPKVLIEDNTEALISLLTQEPYEVTSQGQSSTVTSFGGFVDAGTVLRAIPHISQQDWLRLEYQVELSSFRNRTAAQIAANIPPPKRQSVTSGTVRVPADCMVVLGGLIDTRHDETVDMVPVLGRIPGLGALFRNTEKGKQYQTLFVFIRPVVLRDPEFADLISLTRPDRVKAEVPEESMPANSLQLMESRPTVAPAAATEPSNG